MKLFKSKLFPDEIHKYVLANYKGAGPSEMTGIINAQFNTSYEYLQIKNLYKRLGLRSGTRKGFEKGHTPHNKGKKGEYPPGCEKGWFKPGHTSANYKPIGTESLRKSRYWWVKVAEGKWRQKHTLVWEAANGKRPPGHIITFLDGDSNNFSLDNLALISKAENAVMAHLGYRCEDAELTKTGILLSRLQIAKAVAKRRLKK